MLMNLFYVYAVLAFICTCCVVASAAMSSQMSRLEEHRANRRAASPTAKPYTPGFRTQILYGLQSITKQNHIDF